MIKHRSRRYQEITDICHIVENSLKVNKRSKRVSIRYKIADDG